MSGDFLKMRLLIGELAKKTGVSTDTLRHYERKGVIAPPIRSANGYRVYSPETIERVKLVRHALAVGFTLDELSAIFTERKKGEKPCGKVFSMATAKLEDLYDRIVEMLSLRDELQNLVQNWSERLSETEADEKPAFLLETLISRGGLNRLNNSNFAGKNFRRKSTKNK